MPSVPLPMHSAARLVAAALVVAVSVTCADQTTTGVKLARFARLAITPAFDQAPAGGPDIDVTKIRGVLKKLNGTDSLVAEALVEGDSAILEFNNVTVTGDSTTYRLDIKAFDAANVLVFGRSQDVKVKPGENAPASPELDYIAPDANVTSIDVVGTTVSLQWAGAKTNACLSRAQPPQDTATIKKTLTVTGNPGAMTNVRVGWTSRDVSVATVDTNGLVQAQCSNKATYVVARTFLNVADSIQVNVKAPPFSLLMSPDSTNLARGSSAQLTAQHVDENGNTAPAQQVTWASSDVMRATVSTSGEVRALRNGRVIITASAGDRTTVGVVQVVRPTAASVKVIPQKDTIAFGQVRQYFARAFDAAGRVIGDAAAFQWSSSNTSAATIHSATGVATAGQTAGTTGITASIDGQSNTADVTVVASLPPGTIKGIVKNGSTDAPISGATVTVPATTTTTAADGSFTLGGVKAGDDITVTATGFVPVTFFDAPAFPNQTMSVPPLPMSPSSTQSGTMTGKVINILTGSAVGGITVKAYAGLHSAPSPRRPDVQPTVTTTTANNGTFTMSAAAGAYSFVASGTGYSDGIGVGISIGGSTRTTPDLLMPPAAPGGGTYVVLTWGACGSTNVPCDLDLHMTGPKSSTDATRFQVYSGSGNRSFVATNGDTIAAVDVIASGAGHGPEVIGVRPTAAPGDYIFYVNNVSGASAPTGRALADSSGARVDVFQDNHVIATFFPLAGQQGTLWQVFKYDGARIFPGGAVIQAGNPPTVTLRAPQAAPTPNSTKPRRQ